MPEQGIRSIYSQCPFQIQMWDQQGIISTGTGFYYVAADQWFLVTNWHNVTGKHPLTKRTLSRPPRVPEYLKVKLATSYGQNGAFTSVARRVDIYNHSKPLWFEHPELGSTCDVIALPLERPTNCPPFMHNAANLLDNTRIPIEPGCTVFIIGFPMSISVGFGLPIWKSGYIASEPYYNVTVEGELSDVGGLQGGVDLPAFFVDSQTRQGMSGSPVFASYTGAWDTTNPYGPLPFDDPDFWSRDDVVLGGSANEFVGCYSARIAGREEEAALGLCWRKDVIEIICASKRLGSATVT